ncbi:hypothetical protein NM688_g1265 [Phlebia brevispora]|uniref:Uncharacterized protein n=1 Tax=Phlebia brevispora TaxID=194682 RepID=A0ACC1TCB4_9APHY|nr:hypothetical protein NM688_g1265 [Phlebia brevispora]
MPSYSRSLNIPRARREHRCGFCRKRLSTSDAVKRHIQHSVRCSRAWNAWILSKASIDEAEDNSTSSFEDGESDAMVIDTSEIVDSLINFFPEPSVNHPHMLHVEDIPDEDEVYRWVQKYSNRATEVLGFGQSTFERWRRENSEAGRSQWYSFADEKE